MQVKWVEVAKIAFAIILPNIGGMVGAILSVDGIENWYAGLNKPGFTPPNWLFAPMWVFLYTLLGIASYITYNKGDGFNGVAKWPLVFYLCHLILNWSWSPVFFIGHHVTAALVIIILVLLTAMATGTLFFRINRLAGWLLLPYYIWLSIATALNEEILRLNDNVK